MANSPPRQYVYAAKDRMDEIQDRQRAVRDSRFKYIRNYHAGDPGAQHLAFRDTLDLMEELWALYEAGSLDATAARWFEPRPLEELYDTMTDPHETRNLADDPDHAATLERLRGMLDGWMASTPDLSAIPEEEMRERFWPGGRQPVTEPPSVMPAETNTGSGSGGFEVSVSCETDGASVGYRILTGEAGESWEWRLYTGPFRVEAGDTVEAMAVRYGWRSSSVAKLVLR
jgi:hypothetical protein